MISRYQYFKQLAKQQDLDIDSYHQDKNKLYKRSNYTHVLLQWIIQTIPSLKDKKSLNILNLACGFSDITLALHQELHAKHKLYYSDSVEMLDHLPHTFYKIPAKFPNDRRNFLTKKFDVILLTNALANMIEDSISIHSICDTLVYLLNPWGWCFIGEFVNQSKIKRFQQTDIGIKYHNKSQQLNTALLPSNRTDKELLKNQVTDSTIFFMLQRLQENGCNAYKIPTDSSLPWHQTRDNILFQKIVDSTDKEK